jgi:dihydrolipoamide dehydrogenase
MSTPNEVDVLVLGGGSGGYACALRAAQLGMTVALIEKAELGGTCLHLGCIPTKALLHAAEVVDTVRHADSFGISATLGGIDVPAIQKYKDGVVSRLHTGLIGLVKGRGIPVVNGEGTLTGPRTVSVGQEQWTGKNLVIATGSHTRTLPGLELDGERVLGSEHALALDRVPASVVVLGGGVIGCEFASVWRSFGADVTIVEALPRLLAAEDEASSKIVERAFRKRGISLRTCTPFTKVEQTDDGVLVHVDSGDPIEAELLLVAVGRGPSTSGLGLEGHGINTDRGFIRTDERLRTDVEGVFAVGDVVAGLQLAHRGFAHGIFVAEEIAGLDPIPVDDGLIPRVTYCEPEVASVGMTEAQAREKFGADAVEVATYDLAANGKSQILQTAGLVKLVRQTDGAVVGVHVAGARAGELIGEAQLAVGWEALPEDVVVHLHAHPTQGEAIGEAFMALAGQPLHAHT